MGLFDFFKTRPAKEDSDAAWRRMSPLERLKKLEEEWPDSPKKMPTIEALLEELAPSIENAKIKKFPESEEIELRGSSSGVPVRMKMATDNFWVEVHTKADNTFGTMLLHRGHDKIPRKADKEDAWATEDELRVFLAKGMYVEGYANQIDEALNVWHHFSSSKAIWLVEQLEKLEVQFISIHEGGADVHLNTLFKLEDATQRIRHGLAFCGELGRYLVDNSEEAAPVTTSPHQRVNCSYCGTIFLLGEDSRCPNCGAAHGS